MKNLGSTISEQAYMIIFKKSHRAQSELEWMLQISNPNVHRNAGHLPSSVSWKIRPLLAKGEYIHKVMKALIWISMKTFHMERIPTFGRYASFVY